MCIVVAACNVTIFFYEDKEEDDDDDVDDGSASDSGTYVQVYECFPRIWLGYLFPPRLTREKPDND